MSKDRTIPYGVNTTAEQAVADQMRAAMGIQATKAPAAPVEPSAWHCPACEAAVVVVDDPTPAHECSSAGSAPPKTLLEAIHRLENMLPKLRIDHAHREAEILHNVIHDISHFLSFEPPQGVSVGLLNTERATSDRLRAENDRLRAELAKATDLGLNREAIKRAIHPFCFNGKNSDAIADAVHALTTTEPQPTREPGEEHPILKQCDELHELGFNDGWNGAVEECAKLAEKDHCKTRCGDPSCITARGIANAIRSLAVSRPHHSGETK